MNARPILWLGALLLLPLAALLAGCDARAAEVSATDDGYDVALNGGDGPTAATYLSKDSVAWLDDMVGLARTARKDKVKALPYRDRLEVLQIRLLLEPDELKKADGRSYYIRLVNEGWVVSTSEAKRIKISFNSAKDRATITYRYPGERETFHGSWVLEDGQWKDDRVTDADEINQEARAQARAGGVTEDDLLFDVLAENLEMEIPDSIWDPPG